MDGRRFDDWTRTLGETASRRGVLAATAGGALALLGVRDAAAQLSAAGCKGDGGKCSKNGDCCKGLKCKGKGGGNNNGKCRYKKNCGGKKGAFCNSNNDCCQQNNLECKGHKCKRKSS